MTVKIAKFFSNSLGAPPTHPSSTHLPNAQHYYRSTNYQHQQQQQYAAYLDVPADEDSTSMYSTTASIMTARDHPFNNSQRPLLGERKSAATTTQLLLKKKLNAAPVTNQPQRPQPPPPQRAYLSPYVQQQKRDSAKGLHGFNDFDILSKQYNRQLMQSPHIGYPYGSPPSPTANSTDFAFDTLAPVKNTEGSSTSIPTATPVPRYANVGHYASVATPAYNGSDINEQDYYGAEKQHYIGKPSRFEDDFCSARNNEFAKPHFATAANGGGPFIFGVPHEQQSDFGRMPAGGRGFGDSTDTVINGDSGQTTMRSTSDTSSSSNDCSSSKKGAKFLLRRGKSKRNTKGKKDQLKTESIQAQQEQQDKPTKQQAPTIKCVVVGDGAVGKTNLILSYLENRFNPEHVPTASDIYNADVMVNDSLVHLTVCDTAGQDTLDPLRELCYPDSDVFLLCFSVAKPETFHAIKTKWAPKFCKAKAALILVGTQADMRTNCNVLNKLQTGGEKPISYADAWDFAATIGAKYIETSSATQEKVKEVFDTAIWEGLLPSTLPPTPPFWKKLLCLA